MKNIIERIKENFKNNKFVLLGFILIWSLVVFGTNYKYKDSLGKRSYGNIVSDTLVEVNKNTKIKALIPIDNDVESICIKFATYARKNNDDVLIKVSGNNTKNIYYNSLTNIPKTYDNDYMAIGLDTKIDDKDDYLYIEISSNSESEKSVGVYYSNEKCFDDSEFEINGEQIEGDLTVKYMATNPEFKTLSNGILIYSAIVLLILVVILLLINPKQEKMFSMMAIVFGIIMSILITPMSAPDEQLHYENCVQLSEYIFGNEENHNIVNYAYVDDGYFAGHFNVSDAYIRLIEKYNEEFELEDYGKECEVDVEGSYIGYYIPQVLGIVIGRLTKMNMLKLFYFGRLCNMLFYVLCIYIAIKNTPIHKTMFGIIACSPLFIQQSASYSYDSFVMGLSFILIAFFFKWMFTDEKIKVKDYIIVLIASLAITPAKVVYGLFTLPYCFIPQNRYGSKTKKILLTLLLCSSSIYYVFKTIYDRIIQEVIQMISIYAEDLSEEVYVQPNDEKFFDFKYCLENIPKTFGIVYRTIRYNIKKWFYDSIGYTLSGQSLSFPVTITYILIATVVLSSLIKQDYYVPIYIKVFFILICILIGLFVIATMLLGWTLRGDSMISGIQGRYFSPLLPYFFSVISNKKISLSNKISKYLVCTQIVAYYAIVVYVLSYTFIH